MKAVVWLGPAQDPVRGVDLAAGDHARPWHQKADEEVACVAWSAAM